MFLCAKLTKLERKENFDTKPDPDPERLFICHMCSNTNEALVMFFITKYHTFHLVNN